jgi:hypothetical protein
MAWRPETISRKPTAATRSPAMAAVVFLTHMVGSLNASTQHRYNVSEQPRVVPQQRPRSTMILHASGRTESVVPVSLDTTL